MEKLKLIRTLLQVTLTRIFFYQMSISLWRFNKQKVIQEKSITTIDNILKPTVYICQDNQFNYQKSRNIGYQYMSTFAIGELESLPQITWKGKDGNFAYNELIETLYESDYSDFSAHYSAAEKLYIAPHGWCKLLKNSNKTREIIRTTKQSLFLAVDPSKINNIRTLEMDNGRIMFGPTQSNLFDWSTYEITVYLYDSSINDGRICTNYVNTNSSYGKCVENAVKTAFIKHYGCVPPWFPSKTNLTCEDDLEVKVNKYTVSTNISEDFKNMYFGRKMEMLDQCLRPCMSMNIEMKRTSYRFDRTEDAFFQYYFNNDVIIYTEVYAYEEFDLVVNLGSALGLWLGLSALDICDHLLHFCRKICSKLSQIFLKIQERQNYEPRI